ncbi:MAG: hypothetical protein CMO80_03785 [Verrucomicrobiales bacterium]|nr:hypothetical protein [Verrucomicrobiales bacterium]
MEARCHRRDRCSWQIFRSRALSCHENKHHFPHSKRQAGHRILTSGVATSAYAVRLAATKAEIHEAQTLRFLVFNVELGKGLESSYETLRD